MFGFVHNDLHTNNIMWSGTPQTHLYYRIRKAGKVISVMKVPTYGRIMKIIDFGRASFHLPDPAGFFISDAFYPGNDAATQYNCEPFYDSDDGKKVEPNTSFDLCRLAVSLLESLYDERPAAKTPVKIMSKEGSKMYTETVSPVYNMLWDWLQDDNGQNVLRKPNGDERYPDFELYRVLASSVHKCVPSKQIERPIFESFRCNEKDIPPDTTVFDLFI
jgi:serine/threonine protein kinase